MDFVHLQREQSLCTGETVSSLCLHALSLEWSGGALTLKLQAPPRLTVENVVMCQFVCKVAFLWQNINHTLCLFFLVAFSDFV